MGEQAVSTSERPQASASDLAVDISECQLSFIAALIYTRRQLLLGSFVAQRGRLFPPRPRPTARIYPLPLRTCAFPLPPPASNALFSYPASSFPGGPWGDDGVLTPAGRSQGRARRWPRAPRPRPWVHVGRQVFRGTVGRWLGETSGR